MIGCTFEREQSPPDGVCELLELLSGDPVHRVCPLGETVLQPLERHDACTLCNNEQD